VVDLDQRGVEIEAETIGEGKVAERGSVVTIRYDLLLRRGQTVQKGIECTIDLNRRDAVAGLRYGVEGMRVGGRRILLVPPHLAYGENGAPGIPPRAIFLERDTGFEPATSSLGSWHSTN
jgi:FKBP-type peptidyl-prolyl cis-trans isomerase